MTRIFLTSIMLLAVALTSACGSAPTRYGKGNDHEVVHPEEEVEEDQAEEAER